MEYILIGKVGFLLLAFAYSVPLFIGGVKHGQRVSSAQTFLWSVGVVGFITLQWLV